MQEEDVEIRGRGRYAHKLVVAYVNKIHRYGAKSFFFTPFYHLYRMCRLTPQGLITPEGLMQLETWF
jgi:hypothetical protein